MNLHSAGVVAGVPCHLRVEPWTFKQRCSSTRLNFSRTNTITTRSKGNSVLSLSVMTVLSFFLRLCFLCI